MHQPKKKIDQENDITHLPLPEHLPQIHYHWFKPPEVLEDLELVKKDGRRTPRTLSHRKIDAFRRAMLEGRWRHDTAEPVKYDNRGLLMDGFHRFHAVLKAGVPVLMGMVTELDPSVEPILDSGTAKSRAHMLQQKGVKYATGVSSACGAMWCMERKIWRMETYIDNDTASHIEDKYDGLEAYVSAKSRIPFLRSGVVIAAFYWIELTDPDRGKTFVDSVVSGSDGVQSLPITDIRWMLRETLIRNYSSRPEFLGTFRGRNVTVAVIFRCFQYFLEGKTVNRIKFTMDEKNYPWPKGSPYVVD